MILMKQRQNPKGKSKIPHEIRPDGLTYDDEEQEQQQEEVDVRFGDV